MVKISNLINRPERICSIDASTNNFAFAIFDGSNLVAFGKIKFEGTNTYHKIKDAARKSVSFFEKFKGQIDAIVIEHTIYMNSPKTAADLALIQGALLGGAAQNGIRLAGSINPIAWQTYIGNGKLTKDAKLLIRNANPGKSESWYKQHEREIRKQKTINFININYDTNIDDNDIADAVGVGHYAIGNWERIDK